MFAGADARDAEILALRHQVLVLQRQINRPQFNETDRTILALLSSVMDQARRGRALMIVHPATVIRWHRRLVARRWTQPPTTRPGRPPVDPELRRLIIRLARENPTWGYRRIHGELHRLGHALPASTVWKILRAAGIDPRRDRTGPSWSDLHRFPRQGDRCHRLRLCRHSTPWSVPRPVRHRRRHSSGAPHRDHHQPDRTVEDPSRPQPPHAPPRRPRPPIPCA